MTDESQYKVCSERVLSELHNIRTEVKDIKGSFGAQTMALTRLADKLSDYIDLQSRSIPLRLVFLLFALVFGLVFGIEILQKFVLKFAFAAV